ncbi:MAG: ATP-binding domain-containing protein [Actinomycetota bacterium]|nr:ATP-binding domain-containing protein [Actinomycetota bacterium]
MAFLIPENLRRRNDVATGVHRTARLLQDALDDASTAWYEPLFDVGGQRPDLVVLVPDVGILVLEVLEEKAGAIRGVQDGKLAITKSSAEQLVDDPLGRAQAFAERLRAAVAGSPFLSDDERLPVAAVAVLPYLSRSDGARKRLDQVMDLERCVFRDEIEAGLTDGERFRRQLMRILSGPLRDPLSEEAEKAHRALIHPDTVIGSSQLQFPSATPEDDLKVLDRAQEALAKGLGEGHRVVRGVAGSGKTLILVYRARILARAFPAQMVLVTCYNRSLAGVLQRQLDYPNVRVRRLDPLLSRARRAGGLAEMGFETTTKEERGQAALDVLDAHPNAVGRFDHVLIDEAQDFVTEELAFAVRLLKPDSDSLLVVADAAQNIYSNKFRWKDAGINAVGRTRVLDASYRNTREILEYANDFLMRGGDFKADASIDDETALIPPKMSHRSGPFPTFLYVETPQQEVLRIADHCRALLDSGVGPSSIGVLYGSRYTGGFDWTGSLLAALRTRDVPVFWVTDPANDHNKDHVGEDDSKVVLSTIHSAKGLEFSHVVMCAYLDDRPPEKRVLSRRLIYVGMTRATHQLMLTASGKHEYIADLET